MAQLRSVTFPTWLKNYSNLFLPLLCYLYSWYKKRGDEFTINLKKSGSMYYPNTFY